MKSIEQQSNILAATEEIESIMRKLRARREDEERKCDKFVLERKFASAGNQEMIVSGMGIAEMIVLYHHMDQFIKLGRILTKYAEILPLNGKDE